MCNKSLNKHQEYLNNNHKYKINKNVAELFILIILILLIIKFHFDIIQKLIKNYKIK